MPDQIPYPGKTNQDVINAFAAIDPEFNLLVACYGPWETNGLAIPKANRGLPYRGPRVTDLSTPGIAALVPPDALDRIDALLGGGEASGQLAGIGVWSYSESNNRAAVMARVQQAIDATLRLDGNTVLWKFGDKSHLYPFFDMACQMIHDAGLRSFGWLVNRLTAPIVEVDLTQTAFRSGYDAVIFDYEAHQCFGRHDEAAQLSAGLQDLANQGRIDLDNLYLCCFPNLMDKVNDGLPVAELYGVCQGGMMPMTYGEFYYASSTKPHAEQARRVLTEWATDQFETFLGQFNAPRRPQYRILGLYHQRGPQDSTELAMGRDEAQVWLDELARFRQPFWSIWEPNLITDELFELLRGFRPFAP